MKLSTIKCPNCGKSLEIEDGIDTFFCEYCAHKITIENQSKEENKANVSTTDMEQKEKPVEKKDEEKSKILTIIENILVWGILLELVVFVGLFGYSIWSFFSDDSNQKRIAKKEAAYHAIVASVRDDIENGDYSDARLKIEMIRWETNEFIIIPQLVGEVREWDATRNELLLEIREAETNNK